MDDAGSDVDEFNYLNLTGGHEDIFVASTEGEGAEIDLVDGIGS
jgi:hypothetical protein